MKIAQQYIVEIVFDNFKEEDYVDTGAIAAYIEKQLDEARLSGEASTWRPKGVKMTEINVQYESDCIVEDA